MFDGKLPAILQKKLEALINITSFWMSIIKEN